MNLTLNIGRTSPGSAGRMVTYQLADVSSDMSFLEMLSVLMPDARRQGDRRSPAATAAKVSAACRPDDQWQGARPVRTTTCRLLREFGDTIGIDLAGRGVPRHQRPRRRPVVFDRIIQSGGFISANTGSAPERPLGVRRSAQG